MTPDAAVTVRAPAKLTLSLRITGVREDGLHLIDAEMVTLEWADTVTITPGSSGLSADGPRVLEWATQLLLTGFK